MHPRLWPAALVLALTTTAAIAEPPCRALQPSDPGYADAQEFARLLQDHDIAVRCISFAKVGSYFLGERNAAAFQTSLGGINVVFFPDPDGAERITTELTVSKGHYRYVFRRRERGLEGRHDTVEGDAPLHILIYGRWLVFVWDPRIEEPLRIALSRSRCDPPHLLSSDRHDQQSRSLRGGGGQGHR